MAYDYGYDSFMEEMGGEFMDVAFIFAGVLLIVALIAMVVALVMYIFQGIGLHTMAKNRGIRHAWLAWLPVGNYWLVGCISDQYRYVAKGEVKNRRKVLLGLSIANVVLNIANNMLSTAGFSAVMEQIMYSGTQAAEGVAAGGAFAGSALISFLASVVSIITVVFWHIALYDLYTSCDPKNNVLFLVLGIIFGFLTPFFIFANRKKDKGMPPRKVNPVADNAEPRWQPAEPPKEPWETTEE